MDIFEEKGIKPMLIAEMQEAFDSPDYVFELKLNLMELDVLHI